LNEEEINKIREEVGNYNTEADLVRGLTVGRNFLTHEIVEGMWARHVHADQWLVQLPTSVRDPSLIMSHDKLHSGLLGLIQHMHSQVGGIASAVSMLGWRGLLLTALLLLPPSVPGWSLQRRVVAQNIKRLKDIGCYRGRRHIMVSWTGRGGWFMSGFSIGLCCGPVQAMAGFSAGHMHRVLPQSDYGLA
jgi:hypothetical protein